jgi:hypothetical protein
LEPYTNGWVVDFPPPERVSIKDGAALSNFVPAGAMLVRRGALETMLAKEVVGEQRDAGLQFYNFFGARAEDAARGHHTSDDHSFCRRWRIDCGGEIWALLDAKIGHIGDHAFGADESYLDHLNASGAFQAAL